MKCTSCGFEAEQEFERCPCCGAVAGETEVSVSNPAVEKFLSVLKSGMFLAICILMTCSSVFAFADGGVPAITILFTIFLWLTYSQAHKGIVNANHLRCVSGTVYAQYVLLNVGSIIFIVCGVITTVLMISTSVVETLMLDTFRAFPLLASIDLSKETFTIVGWILAVELTIAGVALLVFNILGMRKIHRFAKSVYQSINSGSINLANTRAAKNWLIVISVFAGISALSSFGISITAAISSACLAAAGIVAVVLISKDLVQSEKQ